MYENLILFGAGASYGSDSSGTPPIGSKLFAELSCFNPTGWGALPDELAQVFAADFERGMAKVPDFNAHWMPVLQRAMASYFFNFAPSPTNLYRKLAACIKKVHWDGACATLNYERLLELSFINSGIRPIVGRESQEDFELELILPHGCCHIFCDAARGMASAVSFSGMAVTTAGPIRIVADQAEFQARIDGDAFPPVMSYFEPTKRTNTGVNFIENQRQRWRNIVMSATTIAIVGVGVRPHDTHIWEPILSSEANIVYCGGPDGATEYEKWATEKNKISSSFILTGYFDEEFDNICTHLNLQ